MESIEALNRFVFDLRSIKLNSRKGTEAEEPTPVLLIVPSWCARGHCGSLCRKLNRNEKIDSKFN